MTNLGTDGSRALLVAILTVTAIPILTAMSVHERWGAEPSIGLLIAIFAARELVRTWRIARSRGSRSDSDAQAR